MFNTIKSVLGDVASLGPSFSSAPMCYEPAGHPEIGSTP